MMTVGRISVLLLGAAVALTAGLTFRAEPKPTRPALEGANVDAETLALLRRACLDCHSEATQWPWYGRLPPGSWIVSRDVNKAREQFNLSRWREYSEEEQQAVLGSMGAAVRTGQMPPGRYTLAHSGARLNAAERDQIYRWTRKERARLRK